VRLAVLLFVSTLAAADLKPPRTQPQHFPLQAKAGTLTLAAEYLVRGLPGDTEVFFVRDYLVVEIAFFPAPGSRQAIRNTAFTLILNKDKTPLLPATPQMVAAALKYEDWTDRPTLQTSVSSDGGTILIGGPQRTPRFPNDPTVATDPTRTPPRVETNPDRSGIERPKEAAPEAAVAYALPEEPFSAPIRGYLYFPYSGKTKSIKKAVLLFRGEQGEATLNLK